MKSTLYTLAYFSDRLVRVTQFTFGVFLVFAVTTINLFLGSALTTRDEHRCGGRTDDSRTAIGIRQIDLETSHTVVRESWLGSSALTMSRQGTLRERGRRGRADSPASRRGELAGASNRHVM